MCPLVRYTTSNAAGVHSPRSGSTRWWTGNAAGACAAAVRVLLPSPCSPPTTHLPLTTYPLPSPLSATPASASSVLIILSLSYSLTPAGVAAAQMCMERAGLQAGVCGERDEGGEGPSRAAIRCSTILYRSATLHHRSAIRPSTSSYASIKSTRPPGKPLSFPTFSSLSIRIRFLPPLPPPASPSSCLLPPMPAFFLPCLLSSSHACFLPPMPAFFLPCLLSSSHACFLPPMPAFFLPCLLSSSHACFLPPMPAFFLPCLLSSSHACFLPPMPAFFLPCLLQQRSKKIDPIFGGRRQDSQQSTHLSPLPTYLPSPPLLLPSSSPTCLSLVETVDIRLPPLAKGQRFCDAYRVVLLIDSREKGSTVFPFLNSLSSSPPPSTPIFSPYLSPHSLSACSYGQPGKWKSFLRRYLASLPRLASVPRHCALLVGFAAVLVGFAALLVGFAALLVGFATLLVGFAGFAALLVGFAALLVGFAVLLVGFATLLVASLPVGDVLWVAQPSPHPHPHSLHLPPPLSESSQKPHPSPSWLLPAAITIRPQHCLSPFPTFPAPECYHQVAALPVGDALWVAQPLTPPTSSATPPSTSSSSSCPPSSIPPSSSSAVPPSALPAASASPALPGSLFCLEWVAERKRVDDLWQSIKSKRFKDQKLRIKHCGLRRPIYVVEGNLDASNGAESLRTASVQTLVHDGFDVHHTTCIAHTRRHYAHLTRAIADICNRLSTADSCNDRSTTLRCSPSTLHATTPSLLHRDCCVTFDQFLDECRSSQALSVGDVFGHMLLQVRGLTVDMATAILRRYPSLPALHAAYTFLEGNREAHERLLCGVHVKGKAVGAAISKRVYELLCTPT
ncbi:unnamed protein product [Closterium sp. Naga37s-1]|nr:unnamed protein product [Closterium sp. Naga37s-1]